MTERLRQIKKHIQEQENLLYNMVSADLPVYSHHAQQTTLYVDDIRQIDKLKKRGIIREH